MSMRFTAHYRLIYMQITVYTTPSRKIEQNLLHIIRTFNMYIQ